MVSEAAALASELCSACPALAPWSPVLPPRALYIGTAACNRTIGNYQVGGNTARVWISQALQVAYWLCVPGQPQPLEMPIVASASAAADPLWPLAPS